MDILINDVKLNSDSTTVLAWVKADATQFKPFVKNKIIEIQDLVPSKIWRYVPSNKNKSADLISKGCAYKDLETIIKGPEVLRLPDREWPTICKQNIKNCDVELEEIIILANVTHLSNTVVDVTTYSSWKKLLRVTAYIFRFINLARKKKMRSDLGKSAVLNKEEIENAEQYWIKNAQQGLTLENKKVKKLVPFIDEKGIIRVYGRLQMSRIFSYDRIHPIILPHDSVISRLILECIHNSLFHLGQLRVVAESRKKYWILGARKLAKRIGYDCVTCRRWRNKSCNQLMSNLPECRIIPGGSPFQYCCIDYFGPMLIKYGRRARTKAYGIIFTCLTTRAIYIDLATDISTDKFLLAFRRFISNFGQPEKVISDNGSNFIGAKREITNLINRWKSGDEEAQKLNNICTQYTIQWTFSTPLAPHHNGVVESMVKSVKSSINKVVKESVLSEEEYRTVFAEVSACINSRPVWPSSDGDVEQPPITCQDLLRPSMLDHDPAPLNVEGNPRKRYNYVQRLVDEWWKLWLLHFIPNLQPRNKWYKTRENLEEGDIVLLIEKDVKRSQWNMGKIICVYPGKDNKVRSVQVKTKKGIYNRPITKICLLVSKSEYENECEEQLK